MTTHNQYCEFCEILQQKKSNQPIIAENELCFAFHDINIATARAHVLVCPKEHIETALDVKDTAILDQLQTFGQQIMSKMYQERYKVKGGANQFRFGFHLPPHVSIFHIHLHCFILPFKNMIYDKALYGFGLKSVEEIKKRIQDMQRPKL